jgi:hypothetical protein
MVSPSYRAAILFAICQLVYICLTFYIARVYNIYMGKLLQALGITKHHHNWMPISEATGQGQMVVCVECRWKGRI